MPLLLVPPLPLLNADGIPYAGGTIETYVPGTDNPKDTWSDTGGTSLNTNPIVLDAAGQALIYGDGDYRFIVRDAAGNLIYDQITSSTISSAMQPVVIAADLPTARAAMGVTAAIQTETDRATAAEGGLQAQITALSGTTQFGTVAADASGNVTVTFHTPFSGTPAVTANCIGAVWVDAMIVIDPSGSGFTARIADHTGAPVTTDIAWIAVG